jgi:hypothetical protein
MPPFLAWVMFWQVICGAAHAVPWRRIIRPPRMHRHLSRAALRADEAPMLGDVDGRQFVGQGERVKFDAGLMIAIDLAHSMMKALRPIRRMSAIVAGGPV